MAEFCLDCWNELNGTCDTEDDWVLSTELDLCEGCGEYKHVVERPRLFPRLRFSLSDLFPPKDHK